MLQTDLRFSDLPVPSPPLVSSARSAHPPADAPASSRTPTGHLPPSTRLDRCVHGTGRRTKHAILADTRRCPARAGTPAPTKGLAAAAPEEQSHLAGRTWARVGSTADGGSDGLLAPRTSSLPHRPGQTVAATGSRIRGKQTRPRTAVTPPTLSKLQGAADGVPATARAPAEGAGDPEADSDARIASTLARVARSSASASAATARRRAHSSSAARHSLRHRRSSCSSRATSALPTRSATQIRRLPHRRRVAARGGASRPPGAPRFRSPPPPPPRPPPLLSSSAYSRRCRACSVAKPTPSLQGATAALPP